MHVFLGLYVSVTLCGLTLSSEMFVCFISFNTPKYWQWGCVHSLSPCVSYTGLWPVDLGSGVVCILCPHVSVTLVSGQST